MELQLQQRELDSCVRRAAQCTSQDRYEEALRHWQAALALATDDEHRTRVLLERALCYHSYALFLQQIPASASELKARLALEPHQLARLGLADAERLLLGADAATPDASATAAHVAAGRLHLLLEDFTAAETAFLKALSQDVAHEGAKAGLQAVRSVQPQPSGRRSQVARSLDDFDCMICCKLLYKPVTTPCGHTFCQGCFARACDHSTRCPMCRRVLHTGRELPVTVVLENIIKASFPEELAARERELRSDGGGSAVLRSSSGPGTPGEEAAQSGLEEPVRLELPVFVLAPMLPREHIRLRIFEPRYRLMIRRCMEGNRRLALSCTVQDECTNSRFLPDIVTECEITECSVMPDGQMNIECRALRRLHVDHDWELDGYRMCSCDRVVEDEPPSDEAQLAAQLQELDSVASQILSIATQDIDSAPAEVRTEILAQLAAIGQKPNWRDSPEDFTWWVAQLGHFSRTAKLQLLMMTCTAERCLTVKKQLGDPERAGHFIWSQARGRCCIQ